MARYVMLEIPDDAVAEDFIRAIRDGLGVIYGKKDNDEGSIGYANLENVEVRGLWMKPTKFCDCSLVDVNDGKQFAKGSKYGIYVHRKCMKPRSGHSQWPKNLLDPKHGPRDHTIWAQTKEPLDSEPTKMGNKFLDNMRASTTEPLPKDYTDRLQQNLQEL